MVISHITINVRFIDSFDFPPVGLSKFQSTFRVDIEKKSYFPYYFNTQENRERPGDLLNTDIYGPNFMSENARKLHSKWHNQETTPCFRFAKGDS